MGRPTAALLLLAAVMAPWWQATPTRAQPPCELSAVFADIRELVGPETVGACLEDQHVNPDTGDIEQRTTRGVLVWRDLDGVAAFSDGVTNWVNGPDGFQHGPSGERFGRENDSASPMQAPSSAEGGSPSQVPSLFVFAPPQPAQPEVDPGADPARPSAPTSTPMPSVAATPSGPAPPTRTPTRVPSTPTRPPNAGRTDPVGGQCPPSHRIKGATSSTGQKTFYEPERPEYAKVTPDACFTAGGDARDAGYASSKR